MTRFYNDSANEIATSARSSLFLPGLSASCSLLQAKCVAHTSLKSLAISSGCNGNNVGVYDHRLFRCKYPSARLGLRIAGVRERTTDFLIPP